MSTASRRSRRRGSAGTSQPVGNELIDLSVLGYFNGLEITEDRDSDGRSDLTKYKTYGFEAVNRSSFEAGVPVTLVYGLEAFRDTQSGTRDGEAKPQFPDAEATTLSGFAEATIAVTDRLEIVPGLRYDHYPRDPERPGSTMSRRASGRRGSGSTFGRPRTGRSTATSRAPSGRRA